MLLRDAAPPRRARRLGAGQLEAAAITRDHDLSAAGCTANGFFVFETALLFFSIVRRSGRRGRTTERQHAIHEALVAAHDALRFIIDLFADVVVSGRGAA